VPAKVSSRHYLEPDYWLVLVWAEQAAVQVQVWPGPADWAQLLVSIEWVLPAGVT
jgi:hypothetical protein